MNETKLRQLYCNQRLSMAEVAERLGATHATVRYWLKKYGVPRRSWSESAYVKINRDGDPFDVPSVLTARQEELLRAGLMLYWAEGSKTPGALRIANLDHRMLQLFAAFLREVCHVREDRLSVYVRLYERFDREAARRYWAAALRLPSGQVFVYPHLDGRSKPSEQWSPYGVATLEFHSTKLKQWLDRQTEAFIRKQLCDGSAEVRDEPLMAYGFVNRLASLLTA